MCQPRKWWWGLLPVLLLWVLANWQKTDLVAADVKARAEAAGLAAAGAVPGLSPVTAIVSGRDVSLAGDVRSARLQPETLNAVDREFGVRRVGGGVRLAQPLRPYLWSAQREGSRILLSGVVPNAEVKVANAEAAARAIQGAVVDDQQRIAFGAPEGFAEATASVIPELARVSSGKATLSDAQICFEGVATTPDVFVEIGQRQARAPEGFTRQACAVTPPTVSPYLWSAVKSAAGSITLSGFYPSDAVRSEINTIVRAASPGATVTDAMRPALGAPQGLVAMITAAAGQLSQLVEGTASLSNAVYAVTGRGPASFDACDALRRALPGQLSQGFSLGSAEIACPPPPPPPPPPVIVAPAPPPPPPPVAELPPPPPPAPVVLGSPVALSWSASKDRQGLTLSGQAPSDAAREKLLAAARAVAPGDVVDNLVTEAELTDAEAYEALTQSALAQLARLDIGTVRIEDKALTIQGLTCREATRLEVETGAGAGLPPGYRASGQVALRQTGCSACQLAVDEAMNGRSLQFEQGSAGLADDAASRTLLDDLANALRACPNARISVEGHTNSDGDRDRNRRLSEARARAVAEALASRGLNAANLTPVGYGQDRPLIPHGSDEAREKNRRVQFTVVEP